MKYVDRKMPERACVIKIKINIKRFNPKNGYKYIERTLASHELCYDAPALLKKKIETCCKVFFSAQSKLTTVLSINQSIYLVCNL